MFLTPREYEPCVPIHLNETPSLGGCRCNSARNQYLHNTEVSETRVYRSPSHQDYGANDGITDATWRV